MPGGGTRNKNIRGDKSDIFKSDIFGLKITDIIAMIFFGHKTLSN